MANNCVIAFIRRYSSYGSSKLAWLANGAADMGPICDYLRMSADGQPAALPNATASAAAASLSLLADDTRLKILWTLMHGEQHVNALASLVGAKAPAVSQHLSKLRAAGMVSVRREGTYAYYTASDDHISSIVSLLVDHTSEELAAQSQVNALLKRPARGR
jgi:DNA-binding transcriptional ArsR family regulator